MKNDSNYYLLFKCVKALRSKGLNSDKIYRSRLLYEWNIIKQLDLSKYFLILYDIIKYAKDNSILVADGRGSAAGSLVCYLLSITNIDPIKFDLMFERFLNLGRKELPDIDTDFDADKRDLVINYAKEKYGKDNVINVGTLGMMKFKSALKNICNVYKYNFHEINEITKDIPDEDDESKFDIKNYGSLNKFYNDNDRNRKIVDMALKLRGSIHHIGIHPAGVLLISDSCRNKLPLIRYKDQIITNWSEGIYRKELTQIGYSKYDILGLNTLSIIQEILNILGRKNKFFYDLYDKNGDDDKVYKAFRKGDTLGIFQFAEDQAKSMLKEIRPTTFEHLTAINAINRPGCLINKVDKLYAQYKNDKIEKNVVHEKVYEILKDTYGLLIYQEQYLKLANQLGHFTMEEADKLRKVISKATQEDKSSGKIDTERLKMKEKFVEKVSKEIPLEAANKLWTMIANSASYSFNKSHSAAYAMLAYKSMWFKVYYPTEFYLANIRHLSSDRIKLFYDEMKNRGIKILPININKSRESFSIEGTDIRYGFSNIKYLSLDSAKEIIQGQPYKSFEDLMKRVKLNKRVVIALIKANAFKDMISQKDAFEMYWKYRRFKEECPYKGMNDFDTLMFEREIYAYILSDSIFNDYIKSLANIQVHSIHDIIGSKMKDVNSYIFIDDMHLGQTKNRNTMVFFKVWDMTSSTSMVCWAGEYYKNRNVIDSIKPGNLVYCKVKYNNYNGRSNLILGDRIKIIK